VKNKWYLSVLIVGLLARRRCWRRHRQPPVTGDPGHYLAVGEAD
jgi:hypothetical protein